MGRITGTLWVLLMMIFLWACSFDYGTSLAGSGNQPDIIMQEVEYVRVRDGEPTLRFRAETVERYEKRQTMELHNFSFEQFNTYRDEINAQGRAGGGSVELDSGNIQLDGGVHIEIESEDITIETGGLGWQDRERILRGETNAEVTILRSDGTNFSGRGFTASARDRTWEFSSGVEGSYTHEDDEEDEPGDQAEVEEALDGETGEQP